MSEAILDCKDLRKVFSNNGAEVEALGEITLSASPGEFIGLFGPSGCGKSTFLLVAGGLLAPTSGSLQVCGKNPYAMDSSARCCVPSYQCWFSLSAVPSNPISRCPW